MMERGFAESTIDAAVWLITYQPGDLPTFLRQHERGHALEAVARLRIDEGRASKLRKREESRT